VTLFAIGGVEPRPDPPGWSTLRLKDATTYVNRGEAPTYADGETGLLAFNQRCIRIDRTIDLSFARPITDDLDIDRTSARLRVGDIVINSTGTGTLGRAGYISSGVLPPDVPVIADGHVTILRADENVVLGRYMWYLLSTHAFYAVANACLAVGSTNQMELGREAIRQLSVAIPPIETQYQIVSKLDREIETIARVMAEERDLGELIRDRRMAEVDRFIEHGGATAIRMQSVESPWIDAIPHNWQLMPLKRCVAKVTVGIVVTPSRYYEDEGVPVLRGLNVRPGRVTADDLVFMSDASNELHSKSRLQQGDVVVVRTGVTGSAAEVPDWAVGGNIVDLLLVRPGPEMRPRFLELLLNSRLVQRQVLYGSVGALQAHFNTGALSNVLVVVPPLPEQDRVLAHLDDHLARYDRLIVETDRAIRLLVEHRDCLVTDAVTGGAVQDSQAA